MTTAVQRRSAAAKKAAAIRKQMKAARETSEAAGSRETSLSSDGGLGIHEPGSNEQGRARDRAKCPAVIRSSLRRRRAA